MSSVGKSPVTFTSDVLHKALKALQSCLKTEFDFGIVQHPRQNSQTGSIARRSLPLDEKKSPDETFVGRDRTFTVAQCRPRTVNRQRSAKKEAMQPVSADDRNPPGLRRRLIS